jgi:PAS domain S-box-containing protein
MAARLTEPSAEIVDRADRRTARLLSTILLLLAPLGLLSALLQLDGSSPGGLQVAIAAAVVAILLTYRLSRTRHFRVAGAVTSLIPTAGGLGVLAVDTSDPGWFAFMALNPALGTLLVPIRWSVVIASVNQTAVLVAVGVADVDGDLAVVAVMFNAIVAVVVVTAAWFRNRLEQDRRADLVAQQRLHEGILAGTFGGIAIVRDGLVVDANEAFSGLFATVHTDLRGTRIDELFRPGVYEALREAADAASGVPVETTALRSDGAAFATEVLVRLIDGEGRVSEVIAMRDITDRKEADEALFRAQRMESVGRLAAGLAHDTNNELMVISALTGELEGEHRRAGLPTRGVEQIRHAAQNVSTLIQRVVLFGRDNEHEPTLIDTGEFLAACRPLWQQVLGRHIDLEVEFDEPAPIRIDRIRLEQVLLNLVLNARDAIEESGTVRVVADTVDVTAGSHPVGRQLPAGRYPRISVSDTGRGIDPDDLAHLFEPFFTTKSDGQSTGLGLYTSREIARGSGGDVAVETSPEGATVSVYLPNGSRTAAT